MLNKGFRISYIIVIILVGAISFYLGFVPKKERILSSFYQVYVDGEIVGMVKDYDSLSEYINQKEEKIKEKYLVNKVYMPKEIYPLSRVISSVINLILAMIPLLFVAICAGSPISKAMLLIPIDLLLLLM